MFDDQNEMKQITFDVNLHHRIQTECRLVEGKERIEGHIIIELEVEWCMGGKLDSSGWMIYGTISKTSVLNNIILD